MKNRKYNATKIYLPMVIFLFLYKDENFECFSKDQIKKELNNYKKIAENIEINLFIHRNSNGSKKEYVVFEEIMERVYLCNDMMKHEIYDTKNVVLNIESIIKGITDLQSRKFVRIYKKVNFYIFFRKIIFMKKKMKLLMMKIIFPMMKILVM
jgi:hypothetical protein